MKSEICQISAIAYGGDGIGRLSDGRVCFVPGTLPGERVEICLTAEKKRFARGRILTISDKSPERIDPDCPYSGECPGCVYRHCSYRFELSAKDQQLRDFLLRNHLADEKVFQAPFGSPETDFYRNKLTLHRAADGGCGYYGSDNETVFPVNGCRLARQELNELLPSVAGDDILLRYSAVDGAKQIDRSAPGKLTEELPGFGSFAVAGDGFFQTNLPVAAELVRQVTAFAAGSREVLELYCGVGVFSIALAGAYPALHCTGVEINPQAIKFARLNAAAHQVAERCRFYAGDAGKFLKKWENRPQVTLIFDPPRGGIEKRTLEKVLKIRASKVIYISCAADTLTRDLKELVSAGYRVVSSQVLDMFPRTAHFESLTVLEKHD